MAGNSPIDLFYVLWHLPLFHSVHETACVFLFPVVFIMPVVITEFFAAGAFRKIKKPVRVLIYMVIFAGIMNMFYVNRKYHEFTYAYRTGVPPVETKEDFFNVLSVPKEPDRNMLSYDPRREWRGMYKWELPEGLQYYLLRQNIGLINWYGNIRLEENAIPRYKVSVGYGDYWKNLRSNPSVRNGVEENRDYHGEFYFLGHLENKAVDIQWKTNEIIIGVDQKIPDTLVINQNYSPHWKTDMGSLRNLSGLLAITLDKPIKGTIKLSYRPVAFYLGVATSTIALIMCIWYFLIKRGNGNLKVKAL
jgi:hypothetical protein